MVRLFCPSRLPSVLLASLALGAAALPVAAQHDVAPRRTPRVMDDATTRRLRLLERRADSLAQLYSDADELSVAQRRAIGEELDRTVEQLDALMRDVPAVGSLLERVRVALPPMIDERVATALSNALRQERRSPVAMPRGWLGIVVSGAAREPRIENGELIIRYLTHPVIVSVEPKSPAERAGLVPTDTLVAYDGRDVLDRDISLTRLLRPNSRVLVRIRRDGRTKDVPVTIADVPSRIRLRSEVDLEMRAPRLAGPDELPFPRPTVPRSALAPRVAPTPPMGVMGLVPVSPPMPATPPMPAVPMPSMIAGMGMNSVAGAQLAALTEGLARAVGVERGVLVTYVPVGSLAYSSGLRDGDVVVRAGDTPVRTVVELREQVQLAVEGGEGRVALDIVRERKPQRLTLRWSGPR